MIDAIGRRSLLNLHSRPTRAFLAIAGMQIQAGICWRIHGQQRIGPVLRQNVVPDDRLVFAQYDTAAFTVTPLGDGR